MRLGERLRTLRQSKKFSAELLAEACGVKAGAYRRWERNETEPSVSQAIALSRVYQTSLDDMLFGSSDGASPVKSITLLSEESNSSSAQVSHMALR